MSSVGVLGLRGVARRGSCLRRNDGGGRGAPCVNRSEIPAPYQVRGRLFAGMTDGAGLEEAEGAAAAYAEEGAGGRYGVTVGLDFVVDVDGALGDEAGGFGAAGG